jgi:hypothetical protein
MKLPVAVWTFVLALLFGAVAPLGPPETLVHGAAFNPATTSVAIAAKRVDQGVAALHQGTRRDPNEGGAGSGAMLSIAPALATALILLVLGYALTPLRTPRPVRYGARRARAPPHRLF